MPRRSTIPLPDLPAVSHVEGPVKMDPSVASAPIRAATSMLQSGLGEVEDAANEFLLKQRQDRLKADKEAKILAEEEAKKAEKAKLEHEKGIYDTKKKILKINNDAALGILEEKFNQESAEGSPEDVHTLLTDLYTAYEENFEKSIEFLNPNDQAIEKATMEAKKRIHRAKADTVYTKRIIDGLETRANILYENNVLDDSEQGKASTMEAEEVFKSLYPDTWEDELEPVYSRAISAKAEEMARLSNNKESLQKSQDFFNSNIDRLDNEQQHSFIIQQQSAVKRIADIRTKMISKYTTMASSGQGLPIDEMNEAVDDDYITEAEKNEFIQLGIESSTKIETEQSFKSYEKNTIPFLRNRLDQLFPEGVKKNPIAILEDFERAEELNRNLSNTTRQLALGQHEILGYLNRAIFLEDLSGDQWWQRDLSRHYGEYIEENVPDKFRKKALDTYSEFITDAQSALDYEEGKDKSIISMSSFATEGEKAIAELFSGESEPTRAEIDAKLKPINEKWIEEVILDSTRTPASDELQSVDEELDEIDKKLKEFDAIK